MNKPILPVRDLCLVGIFAAVTAILSQIAIPLPFTPVHLSLGTLAVYITGALLRPKCAFFAQLCYLLLGAVGLPVFVGFQGGVSRLVGPTGGYLAVYPLMALIISLAINRASGQRPAPVKGVLYAKTAAALAVSTLLLYTCGTAWLSFLNGISFTQGLALAVYPFAPMDAIKAVFCVLCVLPLRERLARMRITA